MMAVNPYTSALETETETEKQSNRKETETFSLINTEGQSGGKKQKPSFEDSKKKSGNTCPATGKAAEPPFPLRTSASLEFLPRDS